MAHFEPLKQVLLTLPGRVRLSENIFLPVQRLTLKPQHGYVLSRIDGSMPIEELALVMPPGEEGESLLFIYGLAVLGIVVFVPPLNKGLFSLREVMLGHYESAAREEREASQIRDTAARMLGQSPAELLGVAPDAALPELQHAYAHLKGSVRRSRFSERTRERFKKELGLIENKIAEAFLKLQVERLEKAGRAASGDMPLSEINPDSLLVRREMVKTEAQAAQEENIKLADKYFQKAREYFAEKDYHNCIQFCRLAIKFSTDSAPVYAVMAEALSKNPNTKWQKMAEEAFQKACEIDPWNAEYEVALGNFYRGQGLEIRARKHFEKALEILPTHPAAKAALKARGRRG
jgi:tetratricopeptide (TPR) repeat protein